VNEVQLKGKLLALVENDFQLSEGEDLDALLAAMMAHIGSLDPELRDELIYVGFYNLIQKKPVVSAEQLKVLLDKALSDEGMFYQLGEPEGDGVFTRAFSVLLLPLILIAHRNQPFLDRGEVMRVQEGLLRFMREEQDRRGFVDGKGWAHAIAHGADALDDLAQCKEVKADGLREILLVVQTVVCVSDTVYTHGEEDRLVTPVIAILRRELLAEDEMVRWIEGFAVATEAVGGMPQRMYIQSNVSNFLQSLYFRLGWADLSGPLGAAITGTLRKMNRFAGN
jgi:Protein of unknown function (DUF2785)